MQRILFAACLANRITAHTVIWTQDEISFRNFLARPPFSFGAWNFNRKIRRQPPPPIQNASQSFVAWNLCLAANGTRQTRHSKLTLLNTCEERADSGEILQFAVLVFGSSAGSIIIIITL